MKEDLGQFMRMAFREKDKSPCSILKVGCVVNTIYDGAICGHNGMGIKQGEDYYSVDGKRISKPDVCHAEEYVIAHAAEKGVTTKGCSIFVTTSPCFRCARLIVLAGISKVYYRHDWWDKAVNAYLKESGVTVQKLRKRK